MATRPHLRKRGPTPEEPVPAGSIVVCDRCDKRLYKTKVAIGSSQKVRSKDFKGIAPVPSPKMHETIECYHCGGWPFTPEDNRMVYEWDEEKVLRGPKCMRCGCRVPEGEDACIPCAEIIISSNPGCDAVLTSYGTLTVCQTAWRLSRSRRRCLPDMNQTPCTQTTNMYCEPSIGSADVAYSSYDSQLRRGFYLLHAAYDEG